MSSLNVHRCSACFFASTFYLFSLFFTAIACSKNFLKSGDAWKSTSFQITCVIGYANFPFASFQAFSILLQTGTAVHSEVSSIIYSALSTPTYVLVYILW